MIAAVSNNNRDLFRKISAGDQQAFKALFDFYKAELFKVIISLTKSRLIAEEVLQEVFISLWISRRHLDKVEEPASYLYRIVFNKVASCLRKEANHDRIIEAAMQHKELVSNVTQQTVDINESRRLIELSLRELPPQQHIVYKLSQQQGLSNDEIACQLNISPHTVRSHLSKAMIFIRTYLENTAVIAGLLTIFSHSIQP